jgi:predicted aspartyl protease
VRISARRFVAPLPAQHFANSSRIEPAGSTVRSDMRMSPSHVAFRRACSLAAFGGLLTCSVLSHGDAAASEPPDELSEIVVQAPEPRFVAPTRRDQIGRIWAPVWINGKGPFRLVLDTGANHSGVTAQVAELLGVPLNKSAPVLLRGVTGIVSVPTIRVDSFTVGDMTLSPAILPIVTDAMGGAQGVLAPDEFKDKRIVIDFKHDQIDIRRSHNERARSDFVTIPLEHSETGLLVFHALVGNVRTQAIIDTGGQRTIGNLAMRDALVRRHEQGYSVQIFDVTAEAQTGESYASPPIMLDSIKILDGRITYGDMHIFGHWHLNDKPALLIGMDVLGLLDTFIIDYHRRELQLRMRTDQK